MSVDIWDGQLLIGDATKPQHEPGPQCQEPNKPHWNTGRCGGCDGEFRQHLMRVGFKVGWYIPAHVPAAPRHDGCWRCHRPWPGGPAYWETMCNECALREPDGTDETTDAPVWAPAYD